MVWLRACSRLRTRLAVGSGPRSALAMSRSTVMTPRMTQGAAKK